jgi:hypothetical protein
MEMLSACTQLNPFHLFHSMCLLLLLLDLREQGADVHACSTQVCLFIVLSLRHSHRTQSRTWHLAFHKYYYTISRLLSQGIKPLEHASAFCELFAQWHRAARGTAQSLANTSQRGERESARARGHPQLWAQEVKTMSTYPLLSYYSHSELGLDGGGEDGHGLFQFRRSMTCHDRDAQAGWRWHILFTTEIFSHSNGETEFQYIV